MPHRDKILILDFGSQVTQLIARRIREAGVYCEIHPFSLADQAVADFAPKGIILSGGPSSVLDMGTPRAPQIVFELGKVPSAFGQPPKPPPNFDVPPYHFLLFVAEFVTVHPVAPSCTASSVRQDV